MENLTFHEKLEKIQKELFIMMNQKELYPNDKKSIEFFLNDLKFYWENSENYHN